VTHAPTDVTTAWSLDVVGELAQQLRVDAIRMSTRARSGHPTSSVSAADLMAVLLARHLNYDWHTPSRPDNDHLVFSKGHASPLLYAMFLAAGVVDGDELMSSYRQPGSPWQGHPTPALPWVDVATGSLGQGLPDAVGIALAGLYLDDIDYHVWVLCGDSELAEGSMWEAFGRAADHGLNNLTAIVDVNRLGMRGPTELQWHLDRYQARLRAFGCATHLIDGHDLVAIDDALTAARASEEPAVILARTVKGHGIPELEGINGWHGKPLSDELAERTIRATLGGVRDLRVPARFQSRPGASKASPEPQQPPRLPHFEKGARIATRTAYGQTLVALGVDPRIVVVDAEVGNSTHAEVFAETYPERYFDVYTAEQQMVAAAIGLSVRGYVPFAATFGAFLTRAYDFIRMAAVSRANIRLAGSHAGVEVGPDGSSQMALEDLAMMRAVYGSTVLYPSDAVSTAHLVGLMAERKGVVYLRTTRGAYPVLYGNDESFHVGGSKVLRGSEEDQITLAGAGVTVHVCLEAADALAAEGIAARVLDLYSVKPIDADGLRRCVSATGGLVVFVEDHHPEGGLGEAAVAALASGQPFRFEHLAVRNMPTSGLPAQLLTEAHIASPDVLAAAHRLLATAVEPGRSNRSMESGQ
jgi:transketolase